MRQRVSLITLGVTDLARARGFYEQLGWTVGLAVEDVAFFQAGELVFSLWDRRRMAADSRAEDGGGWGGITLAHNVGSRREVDATLAEADAAGGDVLRSGAATEWGGYSGLFADPEGHRWEVAHNPDWPLDATGAVTLPT